MNVETLGLPWFQQTSFVAKVAFSTLHTFSFLENKLTVIHALWANAIMICVCTLKERCAVGPLRLACVAGSCACEICEFTDGAARACALVGALSELAWLA
jgi:hypothetical protein